MSLGPTTIVLEERLAVGGLLELVLEEAGVVPVALALPVSADGVLRVWAGWDQFRRVM